MIPAKDILVALAPNARSNYVEAFQTEDDSLARHGIAAPLRIAHFLAQILHETGGGEILIENLTYTTAVRLMLIFGAGHHSAAVGADEIPRLLNNPEGLAERVYGQGNPEKARDLGNIHPGDGYKYRGRGALQTTGGGNYRRSGDRAGVDFHADPDLILTPQHLLSPALNQWTDCALNKAADRNDIRAITRAINWRLCRHGGAPGMVRQDMALANEGFRAEAWQVATADDRTAWLQAMLNRIGVRPTLLVDGRYGPATMRAVEWFQADAGLIRNGQADEPTFAKLRSRFAAASAK